MDETDTFDVSELSMPNPENYVVDALASYLQEKYPGIYVVGEYVDSVPSFPAVTIIQADNSEYIRSRTVRGEQAANIMYEVTVYANRDGYRKEDAYAVMTDVNAVMTGLVEVKGRRMGFYRSMCRPIPNLQDSTIYALTARFKGVDMPERGEEDIVHRIYTS